LPEILHFFENPYLEGFLSYKALAQATKKIQLNEKDWAFGFVFAESNGILAKTGRIEARSDRLLFKFSIRFPWRNLLAFRPLKRETASSFLLFSF